MLCIAVLGRTEAAIILRRLADSGLVPDPDQAILQTGDTTLLRTRTGALPRGGDTPLEQEIRPMNIEERDHKEAMGYEEKLNCGSALFYTDNTL